MFLDDLSKDDMDKISGMINNLTPQQIREATDFVKSKSPMKLFKVGSKKGYKNCKIVKLRRQNNKYKCNYEVRVDDKTYPMTNGSVCSNSKKTKLKYYGCKSGSQMKNAACLLSLAILEGYCQ